MVRYQPSGQKPNVLEDIKKKPSRLARILQGLKKKTGKDLVDALGSIADSDKEKKRKEPVKQTIDKRKKKGNSPEKIQELLRYLTSKKTATMHNFRDDANPDADTYVAYHIADQLGYVHTGWTDPYIQAHQILYSLYDANQGKPENTWSKRHKARKKELQTRIESLFDSMDPNQRDLAIYKVQQIKLHYAKKKKQTEKIQEIESKQESLKQKIKNKSGEDALKNTDITAIEFAKPGDPVTGLAFDTGGEGGIIVKNKNNNPGFRGSSMVVDHHGETQMPPSATTMVRETIKEIGTNIPENQNNLYTKVVAFMNGLDNMGYDIIAAKYRAKNENTDDLFSIAQDAPSLIFDYFQAFPHASGYKSFSDELGDKAQERMDKEVTVLGRTTTVKELVEKKREKMKNAKAFVDEYVKNEEYVSIDGKKYLAFLPNDKQLANTDFGYRVAATIAAGYGMMNVFPGEPGDIYFYHEDALDKKTFSMAHIMRDYIGIIQKTDPDYKQHLVSLFKHIAPNEGVASKVAKFWDIKIENIETPKESPAEEESENPLDGEVIAEKVESVSIEEIRKKLATKTGRESAVDFFRKIGKSLWG